MKVRITEYLDIDLQSDQWCCHSCGHSLFDARRNYKEGCAVAEIPVEEAHPPADTGSKYCFTPDKDYCRLIEFYCPKCGTMIESEYLPPGHPITHEIELDIDALKRRHAVAK